MYGTLLKASPYLNIIFALLGAVYGYNAGPLSYETLFLVSFTASVCFCVVFLHVMGMSMYLWIPFYAFYSLSRLVLELCVNSFKRFMFFLFFRIPFITYLFISFWLKFLFVYSFGWPAAVIVACQLPLERMVLMSWLKLWRATEAAVRHARKDRALDPHAANTNRVVGGVPDNLDPRKEIQMAVADWLFDQIKAGSFNPYGNGQTTKAFPFVVLGEWRKKPVFWLHMKPDRIVRVSLRQKVYSGLWRLHQRDADFKLYNDCTKQRFHGLHYGKAVSHINALLDHLSPACIFQINQHEGDGLWYINRVERSKIDAILEKREEELKTGSFNPYGNGQFAERLKEDFHSRQSRRSHERKLVKLEIQWDKLCDDYPTCDYGKSLPTALRIFVERLHELEYTTTSGLSLPIAVVQRALRNYVDGYGLTHARKLERLVSSAIDLALDPLDLVVTTGDPEPGRPLRALLIKAYKHFGKSFHAGVSGKLMHHYLTASHALDPIFNSQMLKAAENLEKITDPAHMSDMAAEVLSSPKVSAAVAAVVNTVPSEKMGQEFGKGIGKSIADTLRTLMHEASEQVTQFFGKAVGWMKDHLVWIIAVISAVLIFGAVTTCMIWRYLFPGVPEVVYQSQSFSDVFVTGWGRKLATWIYGIDLPETFNAAGKFAVGFKNIKEFCSSVSSSLAKLVDYVSECCTGIPFFSQTRIAKELISTHTDFINMTTDADFTRLSTDIEFAKSFCVCYEKLRKNYASITSCISDVNMKQNLQSSLIRGLLFYQRAQYTIGCKIRSKPSSVHLVGIPDQGKSELMNLLAGYVYHLLGKGKLTNANRYERKQDDQFWSGYASQEITTMDDILQTSDPVARGRQVLEYIYMINTASYPLNMADLGAKGITYFQSNLIITTSNLDQPNKYTDLCIKTPLAFFRRMKFWVIVRLKDGCERPPSVSLEHRHNWELFLCKYNWRDPDVFSVKPECVPITFDELGKLVAQDILINQQSSTQTDLDWSKVCAPLVGPNTILPVPEPPTTVEELNTEVTLDLVFQNQMKLSQYFANYIWGDEKKSAARRIYSHLMTNTVQQHTKENKEFSEAVKKLHPGDVVLEDYMAEKRESFGKARKPGCDKCTASNFKLCGGDVCNFVPKPVEYVPSSMQKAAEQSELIQQDTWKLWKEKYGVSSNIVRYVAGAAIAATLAGIVVVGLGKLCTCVVEAMGFPDKTEFASQSTDKYQERLKKRNRGVGYVPARAFNSQSYDHKSMDLCSKILNENQYWAEYVGRNGKIASAYFLVLSGRVCAIPMHAYRVHGGLDWIKLIWNYGHEEGQELKKLELLFENEDTDQVFLFCPELQVHSDFLRHHMRNDPITTPLSTVVRCTIDKRKPDLPHLLVPGSTISPLSRAKTEVRDGDQVVTSIRKGIYVVRGMEGEDGDCEGAVVLQNNAFEHKFLGVHIGNFDKVCLVAPIFLSDLLRCEEIIKAKYKSQARLMLVVADDIAPSDDNRFNDDELAGVTFTQNALSTFKHPGMKFVGTLSHKFVAPGNTVLRETVVATGTLDVIGRDEVFLQPPWPVEERPARLKPFTNEEGQRLDPMAIALDKYKGKIVKAIPPFALDDRCWTGVFGHTDWSKYRVLTIEEAICGAPDLGLPPIDFNTSVGFPECGYGWTRPDFLKKIPFWIHPKLLARIELIDSKLKQGIIPRNFVIATLKDELRPLRRVATGTTRKFDNGELAWLIEGRRYFGALMMDHEHERMSDMQVGINPYSLAWKLLYERLERFGTNLPNKFASDIKNFDIHYFHWMADGYAYHFAQGRGVPEDHDDVVVIFGYLRGSFYVCEIVGDEVYLVVIMPSGTLVTSYMNTNGNSVKHRNIFYIQCNRLEKTLDFDDHVEACFYGDDALGAIDTKIMPWFNEIVIGELAKTYYNHTHTAADKSETLKEGVVLNEAQFLCRSFVERSGHVYAPLTETTLKSMVQHVRHTKEYSDEHQLMVNVHNSLREWFFHGPDKFENAKRILNRFLTAVRQPVFTPSYSELEAESNRLYLCS